jgi:ATP-dependent Clp protease ATP-binding subunit ClpA
MSSLVSCLDAECRQAIDLARRALPEGRRLDVAGVLDALYHGTPLAAAPGLAGLARLFPPPAPVHEAPPPAAVDDALKRVLLELRNEQGVTPARLFAALVRSEAGQALLAGRGASPDERALLAGGGAPPPPPPTEADRPPPPPTPPPAPAPAGRPLSEARVRMMRDLRDFGTLLTEPPGPPMPGAKVVSDALLQALLQHLYTPRSRNILLVAPPGTGKTSLIHALAAKVLARDPALPASLAELDLFELSPVFPRQTEGGFSSFGPAEDFQRVWRFFRTLQGHPHVVLVIDRLVSFLTMLFRLSLHQELVDAFRTALDAGAITCIGGVHPEDVDRIAELDRSLLRRFRTLHLPPPVAEDVEKILAGRVGRLEKHFRPLTIPAEVLPRAVGLSDQHLRDRAQPEKAIRLLEAACARAALEHHAAAAAHGAEGPARLTETHLLQAMEGFIGPVVLPARAMSADDLFRRLAGQIVGQDEGLRELAEAVVAGRADDGWFMRPGPRGVFLFGGPTGVGKTETATALARILGGGRDALVRVDCQNLQGSGSGWEANTLTWRLLGVAPGYKGHVPGCRDGLLVRVRDFPECVLLFDEFEKADSTVGRLILRILDEGKAQDSEGTEIDFRRCVVVLTSNAGVTYNDPDRGNLVFGKQAAAEEPATVSEKTISEGLLATGLGQEFLGRVQHVILFRSLAAGHIREIIGRQLLSLKDLALARGKQLRWTDAAVDRLAERWRSHPHLGARYLGTLVRIQVLDPLNIAAASGELGDDLHEIVLDGAPGPNGRTPRSDRRREGDRLHVVLH